MSEENNRELADQLCSLLTKLQSRDEARKFGATFDKPDIPHASEDIPSDFGISIPTRIDREDFSVIELDRWFDALTEEIEQQTGEFVYFWLVPSTGESHAA